MIATRMAAVMPISIAAIGPDEFGLSLGLGGGAGSGAAAAIALSGAADMLGLGAPHGR